MATTSARPCAEAHARAVCLDEVGALGSLKGVDTSAFASSRSLTIEGATRVLPAHAAASGVNPSCKVCALTLAPCESSACNTAALRPHSTAAMKEVYPELSLRSISSCPVEARAPMQRTRASSVKSLDSCIAIISGGAPSPSGQFTSARCSRRTATFEWMQLLHARWRATAPPGVRAFASARLSSSARSTSGIPSMLDGSCDPLGSFLRIIPPAKARRCVVGPEAAWFAGVGNGCIRSKSRRRMRSHAQRMEQPVLLSSAHTSEGRTGVAAVRAAGEAAAAAAAASLSTGCRSGRSTRRTRASTTMFRGSARR
mmetsp:Transcript_45384/g.150489  ORF Transcript_45384/g.150489 Transcript_45384/m.150489 type:complete len:313 (-) Transcript_45384:260-1198(-)